MKGFVVSLCCLGFLAGCAPAPGGEGDIKVYAVSDYLHNGILVQKALGGGTNRYTYYSFIELDYYLFGNRGVPDLLKALFANMPSAVEIGTAEGTFGVEKVVETLLYAVHPDGWLFMRGESAILNAFAYASNRIIGTNGRLAGVLTNGRIEFRYYETEVPWNFYYNCANFTADLLGHMGLPVEAGAYTYGTEFLRMKLTSMTPMLFFATN